MALDGTFGIVLAADTFALLQRSARRALPKETGGLLLGVRVGSNVYVVDALQVPDHSASGSRFVLRQTQREEALAAFRLRNAVAPEIGYVGTWHSHPAPVGASARDRWTLRAEAIRACDLISMLILMHDGDNNWTAAGYVGRRHRIVRSNPEIR